MIGLAYSVRQPEVPINGMMT